MALDAATAVEVGEQGETTMRPNFIYRVSFDGDAAYPTGGSVGFGSVFLLAASGKRLTVNDVHGYGLTAGDITHFVRYDKTNDTLLCYVLAGTEVPNATDLSAVSFDLTILAE